MKKIAFVTLKKILRDKRGKANVENHHLRVPHVVTSWHPKHGFGTLRCMQNISC